MMSAAGGPIAQMLRDAQGYTRFHMPGHKGRLCPDDMTEIARTDDLYAPRRGILDAERLAAKACGAACSLMLTGGGTAGILAMLLSCVLPGGKVILPRNAHHAALSACVWGDLNAVFADDLTDAIARHPDAQAVLVTRPDYFGGCIDLTPLIRLCKARGARVLVDEAHGAHFPWWDAPKSAGALGADAWVQSAHKTLPALTGAAWLHLSPSVDAERARRVLRMVQTSSPPFPILASLDNARAWMDAHGRQALNTLTMHLAWFRTALSALSGYADILADDPTRLVIGTLGRGLTGLEAQALLADKGIDIEMADGERIVCICTVSDTQRDFERLYDALSLLPRRDPLPETCAALPRPGEQVLSVRCAALSQQEAAPLSAAAGRIASVSAGMYPPGIPALLPGETITAECAAWLAELPQERRFGVENNCLICVK